MTFIVYFKNGSRETYSTSYDETIEQERDAAWDEVSAVYPEADYIEEF